MIPLPVKFVFAALVLVLSLWLVGCSTPLPDGVSAPANMQNACLPQAIQMTNGLRKEGIPSEVLLLRSERNTGHAVSVYWYQNKTWVWDAHWGSVQSTASALPLAIGSDWWTRWGIPNISIREKLDAAWFLEK
jgi:hypothetical protein